MMRECPAEFVVERLPMGKGYSWAVCQPDAAWGEYYSGKADTERDATIIAQHWLAVVHRKQGY